MIKLKTLGYTGLLIFLLIGLSSCNDEEIIASASGDVFITVKVEENDTLYGLAMHGFGNKNLSSITSIDENNTLYTLDSYYGSSYEYFYETDDESLSESIPGIGDYTFAFTFENGETDSDIDELTEDCIYPTTITTCEYDSTEEEISLEWDTNSDADFIVIYLNDENGDTTFISNSIDGSTTSYSISSDTEYWGDYTPVEGEEYTVTIYTYLYETDEEDLNIQCRAENTSTVIWGE